MKKFSHPRAVTNSAKPQCSVCASTSREKIEKSVQRGETDAVVATRYGVSRSALQRHRADHMSPEQAPAEPKPEPAPSEPTPTPPVTQARPADASPLDRARQSADEAVAALQQAEARNFPPSDIARLRNASTNAEKLYAQLASSRQLTPEAIVRTAGWAALVGEIAEALKPYPEAARAVLAAMRQ